MPSVRRRPPGPGQHPLADLVRSKNPQVTTSTISNENLPLPLDKLRLTLVSPKKRNSRKRKTHRQGPSGNPQRRIQELEERRVAQGQSAFRQLPRKPLADPDRTAFRELAYRLAGGAPAAAWWRNPTNAFSPAPGRSPGRLA
jgi:hypothetical protein